MNNNNKAMIRVVILLVFHIQPLFGALCSVCRDGSPPQFPQKILPDSNYTSLFIPANSTCASLDSLSSSFDSDSTNCLNIRVLGTELCGCPEEDSSTDNIFDSNTTTSSSNSTESKQCQLCPGDGFVTHPDKQVYGLTDDNDPITCENLESSLLAVNANSSECAQGQELGRTTCGCSNDESSLISKEQCTLCPLGEATPWLDKSLEFESFLGVQNCGQLDFHASMLDSKDVACQQLRGVSRMCGCASPVENSCRLCGSTDPTIPYAQVKYKWFPPVVAESIGLPSFADLSFSCDLFDALLTNEEEGSDVCLAMQFRGESCGCPNRHITISIWLQRTAGMLSALGSLYIVYEVLHHKKRRKSTYHQLVLGMSAFDIFSSIGYVVGPLALPAARGVAHAQGNDQTCTAQAWFIQLGLSSVFYNFALAVYFWLVVVRKWTEREVRQVRRWAHGAIVIAGIIMACSGIPFYSYGYTKCAVFPPPVSQNWLPAVFFYILPTAISLLGATVFTVHLVYCVKVTEHSTHERSMTRREGNSSLTSRVFWQSVWFLAGFWVAYPIIYANYAIPITKDTLWLNYSTAFLHPLQGAINCIIYMRRKHQSKPWEWAVGLLASLKKSRSSSSGVSASLSNEILSQEEAKDRKKVLPTSDTFTAGATIASSSSMHRPRRANAEIQSTIGAELETEIKSEVHLEIGDCFLHE